MSYFNGSTIRDSLGNEAEVGLFGGLKVSSPLKQISETFNKPLDTVTRFTVDSTGSGTNTAQHNRSLLQVRTGGNGTSEVQTKTVLRYKTASTIESYFTAGFHGTPGAGDKMFIGLFDDEDGVYLGKDGTDFIVAYRNTNVGLDVTQTVDMSNYDTTKIHRFRIRFGYLGVGNISYEIMNGLKWDILHIFQTDGSLEERTHVGSPILPMRCEVSSTSNDLYIVSGSWASQTYSEEDILQDSPFFTRGSRTVGVNSGQESALFAMYCKTTNGLHTNKARTQLLSAEFGTGSEGLYSINVYRMNTVSGTFTDVATDRSIIQVSSDTTQTPIGDPIFATEIAVPSAGIGVASSDIDFSKIGLLMNPGEYFLVTKECLVQGSGNDITTWNIAYADLF